MGGYVRSNGSARVELRVHGVSGTPPERILQHPEARRVAGDQASGFFRRIWPAESVSADTDEDVLEAYSWGRLTSGGRLRVLWLLLIPFLLVNVAFYARPVDRPGGLQSFGELVQRLLRRADGPRADQPGRIPDHDRPGHPLLPLPGQRDRRGGGQPAHPRPAGQGGPADLRRPAPPPVRPILPRLLRRARPGEHRGPPAISGRRCRGVIPRCSDRAARRVRPTWPSITTSQRPRINRAARHARRLPECSTGVCPTKRSSIRSPAT
jgi:hypothetical protein